MNKHFGARDAWTERARAVPIEHEIDRRGIKLRGTIEREGPCPKCGGTDRFSINTKKQCWNCRGCNAGGDVIALVQHLDGVDFLGACTVLAGDFTSAGPHRKAADERKIVAEEYRYEDEAGELSFVVKRMEYQLPDGTFAAKNGKKKKTFAQCRPEPTNPNKWIWNVEGLRPLLYRLPAVLEAVADERPILIVEGERKVDLLASWNVPATCNAGGAKKWKVEHARALAGADVVILPDNDTAGHDHLEVVANSLVDYAASIRVLKLPGLKAKEDIIDWAARGGTVERLHDLIEREAKPWIADDEGDLPRSPEHSDDALALEFAEKYGPDLRYVGPRSKWILWHSWRWIFDETLWAFDCSRAICRDHATRCANSPRVATNLASAKTVSAVERLAKADRIIAAAADQWDVDADIFNTPLEMEP